MKVYFLLLLLFPFCVSGQNYIPELPKKDGQVVFSKVFTVEGASKNSLFVQGKLWFAEAFKDSKEVVQVADKESGILVGKGNTETTVLTFMGDSPVRMHFTARIECREGRYKAEISNISYSGYVEGRRWEYDIESYMSKESLYKRNGKVRKLNMEYMKTTSIEGDRLLKEIESYMAKTSTVNTEEDDW